MYQIRLNKTTKDVQLKQVQNNIRLEQKLSKISLKQTGRVGASAYQVWLNQGNTGSEADYLASLKGEQGPPGADGQDGRNIMLRNNGDWVQWKYEDEAEWTNLIELADLKGEPGKDGEDGLPGADGREVELQKTATHIQWRYEGGEWVDLIALDDLKGADGAPGPKGDKGEKGDTGPGVAAGGTTGQVLAKASNDDYDTEWVEQTGGGGGSMDDFTVAGDSGTPQTISDGNTLTIAGGTGIDTVAENTDKLTVALDSGTQSSLSKADSALQSGDNISELTNDAGYTSNAGTVTSVAISGSDGIEVDSGSPITSNGTIAIGINKTSLLSHLNVEDGADVTDATNVAAAGAVMESDTSTANMSFVIDEDDMASNSATKVPTQQSVKKYVDDNSGGGGGGITQTDLDNAVAGRMADGVWVTSSTYYVAPICQGINLTFAPTFNRVYLYPLFAPSPVRSFVMGVSFSAVTGTIMVRQALFASDAQGRPTGAPFSKHSSTRTAAGPHNQVLAPYVNFTGKVWLAVKIEDDSGGATCTVRAATGAVAGVLGASSVQIPLVTGYPGIAWDEAAGDFGAAPAESSFLYGQENIPRSYIRVQNAV